MSSTQNTEQLIVGDKQLWGGTEPFGLNIPDLRQHVYVIGKTGSGKTTLLRNLIVQLIETGHGVGVIDPHGDLADELLDCIPPWRTDHLMHFDPADFERPIGFNLLAEIPPDERHLAAAEIVGAFKSVWRDSWGPRMEYILYNALAALLDCRNVSLLGVNRMLVDQTYRAWVVRQVRDPLVRSFWLEEFENYDPRFMKEAVAPIQNKIGQFMSNGPIRNILSQVKSRIDFRFLIDQGRIFIAKLAKGGLGEEKANLLGSLLTSQFQFAAMRRSNVPEEQRRDFFLFIDEFHNFTTDSFASILSEARKYRLNLILSHQYIDQVSVEVRKAVFGNVGTLLAFRAGHADAEVLQKEFGESFCAEQFGDLDRYEVYAKPLIKGVAAEPSKVSTLPPTKSWHGCRENMVRRSREKYSVPRAVIEDKILRWAENWSSHP